MESFQAVNEQIIKHDKTISILTNEVDKLFNKMANDAKEKDAKIKLLETQLARHQAAEQGRVRQP